MLFFLKHNFTIGNVHIYFSLILKFHQQCKVSEIILLLLEKLICNYKLNVTFYKAFVIGIVNNFLISVLLVL